MADDQRPRGSRLNVLRNYPHYVLDAYRVILFRPDLTGEQTTREINLLRRKHGLKEWDL